MLASLKQYKGLNKEIYIISMAQLINKLGTFVFPFLTLYLTEKEKLSTELVGVIMSFILCCSLLGSLIGGKLSDKFSRKNTYLIFQSLAGIFLVLCTFADNKFVLIVLLGFSNFCYSAVVPTLSALVADILKEEDRQVGYSLLYLCSNIGTVLGPLIGMILYRNYTLLIFIIDGVSSLIAVMLVYKYIEIRSTNISEGGDSENLGVLKILKKQKYFMVFFGMFIAYTLVYTQKTFSLPLALDNSFGEEGINIYGSLLSLSGIIVCVITPIVTGFTKRKDSLINIASSGLIFTLGFAVLMLDNSLPIFTISIVIVTIGEILLMNNLNVFIANNSPKDCIGRLCSLISVCWSIGSMIGTAVIGMSIEILGFSITWFMISLLAFIASSGMYNIQRHLRKKSLSE